MTPAELKARVAGLTVWKRGNQRAPHKPLLLLLALGAYQRGRVELPYEYVEPRLSKLLLDFGPPRKAQHPEYPFWRLQNDDLWRLSSTEGLVRRASNTDPTVASLRRHNPAGSLPPEVREAVDASADLLPEIAKALLSAHFPDSLHEDLLVAVGLDVSLPGERRRKRKSRDPKFRDAVLRAYGYQCALCGFGARLGDALVGVDAAHVQWKQADGPDEVANGLALCALHHRLFDRGAFTLTLPGVGSDVRAIVAESAHGPGAERALLQYHTQPIAAPSAAGYVVREPFVRWHRKEVAREPLRAA